jgi:hypothetical protein
VLHRLGKERVADLKNHLAVDQFRLFSQRLPDKLPLFFTGEGNRIL